MAKTDWYTVSKEQGDDNEDIFVVLKYDKEGDWADSYQVTERLTHCSCPAHVPWCRHKQIIQVFQEQNRIGTGWTYNFDRKEWKEPIVIEE